MNPLPPCDHDECPATGCEATPETDAASQGIFYVRATAKLCRTLELERNRLRERVAALERAQAPGSVAVTHEQLKAVLKQCRWGVESAPGDSPPDGYETLSPEQTEIADACWLDGMDQLSTALLNWCHDQVKLAPAPVAPAADAAPVTVTDISPLTGKPIRSEFPKCPGCGNEINPDVCCCGETIKGGHHDNHYPVPLGCECLVDKGDDAEIKAPAPVPTPPLQWHPLFAHMSEEHGLTLLDSELHEIALKVDESRAAAKANAALEAEMVAAVTVPAPAPALTEPLPARTEMKCRVCGGFSSAVVCWTCSQKPVLTREQILILQHESRGADSFYVGGADVRALQDAGLIAEKPGERNWWRITEAGRRALREQAP